MNAFAFVFVAALAVAHGSVIGYAGDVHSVIGHGARTTHLQGPSASAHLVGNDGSQIVGHAPGASITASEHVGGASVAYSAPVVAHHAVAHHAVAAPVVSAYSAPVVAHHAVAHAAPVVSTYAHASPVVSTYAAHAAPFVAHHGVAHAGYAAPAVVAHHAAPVVSAYAASVGHYGVAHHGVAAYAAPVAHHAVAHAAPIIAHHSAYAAGYPAWAEGSGIEGQYLHDYNEKLYDDGSYKGEIY